MGTIRTIDKMAERGCTVTIRWVPGHADIAGNEAADKMAKAAAAEQRCGPPNRPFRFYTKRASLTYLKRKATEVKSKETNEWITTRIRERPSYTPPKKSGFRKQLKEEKKRLAARYYQLATGHALIAPYMKNKLKKIDSDLCWWCERNKVQSRHHLFTDCDAFKPQIKRLWKEIGRILKWKHPRSKRISYLFREEAVTGAVLQFLRDTGVGKVRTGWFEQSPQGYWEAVERDRWGSDSEEEDSGGET